MNRAKNPQRGVDETAGKTIIALGGSMIRIDPQGLKTL